MVCHQTWRCCPPPPGSRSSSEAVKRQFRGSKPGLHRQFTGSKKRVRWFPHARGSLPPHTPPQQFQPPPALAARRKQAPRDLAPIADTSGASAAITTTSAVAGGAVKLRGSAGPPFHGLGKANGGARAGVDCSFAAIISGANSECDCAVVALVAPSHLAPPARALKLSSTPGTCRPRVESNLIGARALPYRRRGARGAVWIEVLAIFSLLTALSHFAALAALTALTAASHLALLVSRLAKVAAWAQMPEQPQEQPLVQQPLEQPSPLPLQRRSLEPPRAAHPVRVRVAACLRATPRINYLRHRYSLAAPASRRSAAA